MLVGGNSSTGLMRTKWNRKQPRLAARGQLQFTPELSLLGSR